MTTITPRPHEDLWWRSSDAQDGTRPPEASQSRSIGRLVVVGFSGSARSRAALRWASQAAGPDDRLLVVHATGAPVSVRNGPSRAVAERLGSPLWATVRATVDELVGRDRADTIVEHGEAVDVLARHGSAADLVVVGAGRRRHFRRLVGSVDCVVLAIAEGDVRREAAK